MNRTFRKSILFSTLLILCGCQNYHSKKGLECLNEEDYKSALFHFHKANEIESHFENDLKIAEAYFKIDELDSSELYYSRALEVGANFSSTHLPYAKVLFSNMKYRELAHFLEENEIRFQYGAEAEMLLNICNSIHYPDSNLIKYHPRIKEGDVNAFSLKEYRNGEAFLTDNIVYNGKSSEAWTNTVYSTLLNNDERTIQGEWITRELIDKDKYNRFFDGPATFSQDGKTVYFTRSDYSKHDSIEKHMIVFRANLSEGRWTNLEEFEFNSDAFSVGHVALSPNDEMIYFASDMPGGYGGLDVYSCRKENGKWMAPENLGPAINSNRNECFPYIDSNNALFYASDQSNDFGKLDVFISYFDGVRWVNPQSINYKLKSENSTAAFSFDQNYEEQILTERTNGSGSTSYKMAGKAVNKVTQAPVQGASIQVTTGKTGELIQVYSDENGNFNLDLEKGIDYVVFLKNKNSFTKTTSFSTKNRAFSADFLINYQVEVIELNQPIKIAATDFKCDEWEITQELKNELDRLVPLLRSNSTVTLEIGAHSDVSGVANYNKILTEKRAFAVVEYLISQGINKNRLSFTGHGEETILNKCISEEVPCTEKENAENRRIEYTFLSY